MDGNPQALKSLGSSRPLHIHPELRAGGLAQKMKRKQPDVCTGLIVGTVYRNFSECGLYIDHNPTQVTLSVEGGLQQSAHNLSRGICSESIRSSKGTK